MPSSSLLDPLSSITSSASGLDTGATLENEAPPTRPTPPSTPTGGSADKGKGDEGKEGDEGGDKEKGEESWWEWLTHKADGIEEWVDQFIQDHVKGGNDGEKDGKGE